MTVSIQSTVSEGQSTESVLAEMADFCVGIGGDVRFVYAFYGCDHDGSRIHEFIGARFPAACLVGGASCAGVMSGDRVWGPESIGFLTIADETGDYGSAQGDIGEDGAASAEAILHAALADAGCPGELPDLVWVFQAPGREEEVIDGLRRVVGDHCPIIGGSSADNTVEGNWHQLGPRGLTENGLVVGVLFPSGGVSYAFQGGYEPAGPSGIVTRVAAASEDALDGAPPLNSARSSRSVIEIDHQPAADVYNRWIGNGLDAKMGIGGSVLTDTTMCPLALDAGEIAGIPQFRLVHPESVTAEGAVNMFAQIDEGARVHAMTGNKDRLIERAGRVAKEAAARLPGGPASLAGGLVVYCAGCMLAVDDRMPDVAQQVTDSFAGAPYLGCFTFGEQGQLVDRNVHGNLMISAVVFGQ